MKRALLALLVLGLLGAGAFAYYRYSRTAPPPTVTTAAVTRGDLADMVGATGTLQAVTTVQVGTQVSGTIQELHADFNSLVRKGQVIARLDPSLFQTQVEQANANLIRAEAELERLKVSLDDARTKAARARELSAKKLIPQSELDTAEVSLRATEAQIRSQEASVRQAEASLNQNKVNLQHTVITAPIDGLVISRNVDVGQTVAASMNAPTLYVLAADLTKMQVVANLDESDVGRIRPGQRVTFRVDAYPAEDFSGSVAQVRLQPIVQQNVVTYATVIDVNNPELKLKPGMTANVSVEIARRAGVLRVPNAALRFRPTSEIFAALGQPQGEGGFGGGEAGRGGSGTGRRAGAGENGETAPMPGRADPPPAADGNGAAGGERGRGGFDRRRLAERMASLPAEERERVLQRMRERGLDPSAAGDGAERAARGRGLEPRDAGNIPGRQMRRPEGRTASREQATTIDALFGPLTAVESRGRVWLYADNKLLPVPLRLGISDGQFTELLDGDLQEGTHVVTNVITGTEATRPAPGFGFPPFMGPGGRGGFGPGGRGGRGGD